MRIGMIGLGRMGANMVRRLLNGGHGFLETAEMAGADGAASQDRRKLQLDPPRKRERAF